MIRSCQLRCLAAGDWPVRRGGDPRYGPAVADATRGQTDVRPRFCHADYAEKAADLLELVRVYGHVPTLIGCSGTGLVASRRSRRRARAFR